MKNLEQLSPEVDGMGGGGGAGLGGGGAVAEEAILIGLGDIGLSDAPGLQPIAPSKPISLSVDFPSRRDRWQTEMVFWRGIA